MLSLIATHLAAAIAIAVFIAALLALFVGCVLKCASDADRCIEGNGNRSVEFQIQERSSMSAWLVFHAIAFWSSASRWYRLKRVCAWHEPKPIRMGGNPLAKQVTHGICPKCFARVSWEIAGHEPELRSREA